MTHESTESGEVNRSETMDDRFTIALDNVQDDDGVIRIETHEEFLEPVIREISRGKVLINKRIEEVPQELSVDLTQQGIAVERVPIGQVVETAPGPRWEEDTFVMPIVQEEIVVQRRLVLVEEVRLTRTSETEQHLIPGTIRREVIEIVEDLLSDGGEGV